MTNRHHSLRCGFSLIELIVVIAVTMLLLGGLLISYNNYNQNQIVKQAAQTVKANLHLAQSRAQSGVKPTSGCTELTGYTVIFAQTSYSIQAQCSPEGLVGSISSVSLPTTTSFAPIPSTLIFGVLARGLVNINNSATITISGFNINYDLIVEVNGTITDGGFQ